MAAELAEQIQTLVKEHYRDTKAPPLLLSSLGTMLRRHGFAAPRIKKFISENLPSLRTPTHPDVPQLVAVCDKSDEQHVFSKILAMAAPKDPHKDNVFRLSDFHHVVRLAFCVRKSDNEKVFLKPAPDIEYYRGTLGKTREFIEIPERYRKPGLWVGNLNKLNEQDENELTANIARWAEENSIPIRLLEKNQKITNQDNHQSALERLILAQPADIRPRMVIPADIIQLLMKQ